MKSFLFQSPTKVKFGVGASLELAALLAESGAKRPMIVSGTHVSKTAGFLRAKEALCREGYEPVLFLSAVPDPPIETVDEAAAFLRESGCDAVIAIGGGSSMDTAKAMAMLARNEGSVREYLFGGSRTLERSPLPLLCVPTTAGSGSEVTAASVISDHENHVKLSVTNPRLFPRCAVIDPGMQLDMPAFVTATTGMDALTHAVESYVSQNASPFSDAYGAAAMKRIAANLRTACREPQNLEARSNMAVASCMAATAYASGGLGAVHGMAQALGGVANVAHGTANALLLPYVLEKNIRGNPVKFAGIAGFLGADTAGLSPEAAAELAVREVHRLAEDLNIPRTLREVGVTPDLFPAIIKRTMEYRLLKINPVPLTEKDIEEILQNALE